MKLLQILLIIAALGFSAFTVSSCGNKVHHKYYSSSSDDSDDDSDDRSTKKDLSADEEYASSENSSGSKSSDDEEMVVCPMCNGSGVFGNSDEVMTYRTKCSGCNGTGQVTASQARNISEMMRKANEAVYGTSGGSGGSTGGSSSSQNIEYELKKAYERLYDMEREREMMSSRVASAQMDQLIIQQKEYIQRLESQL